jgi:hypothetical protein
MVLGVGVMLIVSLLGLGVFARTISTTDSTRRTQDYNAALAAADGGVAEAAFRIDQGPSEGFEGSGALGASTYAYRATRVEANRWTVRSTGVVEGVPRSVAVDVERPIDYPYAIFTKQNLRFNGNGGDNVASYNPATGPSVHTGNAIVGSNRGIICNGGGGGDGQDYFTPDGSVSGCAQPRQRPGPRVLAEPAPPAATQPCPAGGTFTSPINGQGGLPFLCDRDITFAGGDVAIVHAPAVIYVTGDHRVSMAGSRVNRGPGTKGKDFLLLKAGTGAFEVGNGAAAADLNGVVYAPSTDITVNGGKLEMDGSLTLNSLTINGNPNFEFLYDDSIMEIATGPWRQEHWREVASGTP